MLFPHYGTANYLSSGNENCKVASKNQQSKLGKNIEAYIETYWLTSGSFNTTEKIFSNSDRSKISNTGGSFSCVRDKLSSVFDPLNSLVSPAWHVLELRFFRIAAQNPAAQTC